MGDRFDAEQIRPVPFPLAEDVLLGPPDEEETRQSARGIATAVMPAGGLTDVQQVLLEAVLAAMTGTTVDLSAVEPMDAAALGEHLRWRDESFRTRTVQIMLLGALVLRPLPVEVVERVRRYAATLSVEEEMIDVAERFADGALGLAAIDFERSGYTADWHPEDTEVLHASTTLVRAWEEDPVDPALARRWEALEHEPPGSIGRRVWELYRSRGFHVPGTPGAVPPLLAQHDWVHVLGDYGTTVEGELETFAFIARANDDPRGFSLLAMVVSLFETGYLRRGAGLFEYDQGHLSADRGVAVRMADAMRRGALSRDTIVGTDSIDFLRLDWFEVASIPLDEVRRSFSVPPKSAAAIAAGSVGPFDAGGISPFQLAAGRALAEASGVPYDAHGASVAAGDD